MGATKRIAELIIQGLSRAGSRTKFSIVRFGNVLGSSGSVVPLFQEQIAQGGPITLTDTKVTRFFMTIPEAATLVIQAGSMASGGEVYVLDMGEPVPILRLAEQLIRLSGHSVKSDVNRMGDIEIITTGLRPGEKLYEELLIGGDVTPTQHPKILSSREAEVPSESFDVFLARLVKTSEAQDLMALKSLLVDYVEGYSPGL